MIPSLIKNFDSENDSKNDNISDVWFLFISVFQAQISYQCNAMDVVDHFELLNLIGDSIQEALIYNCLLNE